MGTDTGAIAAGDRGLAAGASSRRDFSIDLLRAIAIIEVVLAHSNLPGWLFQARNFGVPLLMLLSGWSISLALSKRKPAFGSYIRRRFERLVIPTWTFLACYFIAYAVLDVAGVTSRYFTTQNIINGFLFGSDIDYVWVIRVNLLLSLITPFLLDVKTRDLSPYRFIFYCFLVMSLGSALWVMFDVEENRLAFGAAHDLIKSTVFYVVGYGSIFAIGMTLSTLSKRGIFLLAVAFGFLFVVLAMVLIYQTGNFVPTQSFKYPPQLYYLCYALAVSLTLIAFRDRIARLIVWPRVRGWISFIGSNTLWIYLWHIAAIDIVMLLVELHIVPAHFVPVWIAICFLSISVVWLQGLAVQRAMRIAPQSWGKSLGLFGTMEQS